MELIRGLIRTVAGRAPEIGPGVTVMEGAIVAGRVTLGPGVTIWFNAIVRAETNDIVIGAETNIQDGCILHVDEQNRVSVGARVTVGHGALVHGCTIEDDCLIGMRATVMNGAVIGAGSLVGAGALVTERFVVPPGSVVLGSPARIVRRADPHIAAMIRDSIASYRRYADMYRE